MVFLQTFLKYFLSDIPVIITSFICMWVVISIWLPHQTTKRKWITLFLIESFEHLIMPLILLTILLTTSSNWTWILFHLTLNLFLFGFLGKVVIKAKTKDDWIRIVVIGVFTYAFVFLYPYLLITLQFKYGLNGLIILLSTNFIFLLFYIFNKRWKKKYEMSKV